MFLLRYATENQSDPIVVVAVANGATHLFGALITSHGMMWVELVDSSGQIIRCWSKEKGQTI